jgi:hypothetical protein
MMEQTTPAAVVVIRRRMATLTLLLLCLFASTRVAYAAAPDPAMAAEVKALAGLISDGVAEPYLEATVIRRLGATQRHGDGMLVLFTMESFQGRNDSLQFMAFFAINSPGDSGSPDKPLGHYSLMWLTQVGEDGDRFFDTIEAQGNRITLKGHVWTRDDPHCCPSGAVQVAFVFGRYLVSEVKNVR